MPKIFKNKFKQKQPKFVSDNQWRDLIIVGELPLTINKQELIITDETAMCILFKQKYYGLDLFEPVSFKDIEAFKGWQYKLKLNGLEYLLVTINSIKDKYKIAYYCIQ